MRAGAALAGLAGIRHGFLTRNGGVSGGLYASLNCGLGTGDAPDAVAENRRRALARAGLGEHRLATLYQVHSAEAVVVDESWDERARPRADGLATNRPGLALGILTADCAPLLLADAEARVVGAAHAGWKGALGGVAAATLAAMESLGASRARVAAVIGPCIAQASYEVGAEFPAPFLAQDPENRRFFAAAPCRKFHFDLPGYLESQLAALGVGTIERLDLDTCADEASFFSYRRMTRRREPDYGRQISLIGLLP